MCLDRSVTGDTGDRPPRRVAGRAGEHGGRVSPGRSDGRRTPSSSTCAARVDGVLVVHHDPRIARRTAHLRDAAGRPAGDGPVARRGPRCLRGDVGQRRDQERPGRPRLRPHRLDRRRDDRRARSPRGERRAVADLVVPHRDRSTAAGRSRTDDPHRVAHRRAGRRRHRAAWPPRPRRAPPVVRRRRPPRSIERCHAAGAAGERVDVRRSRRECASWRRVASTASARTSPTSRWRSSRRPAVIEREPQAPRMRTTPFWHELATVQAR